MACDDIGYEFFQKILLSSARSEYQPFCSRGRPASLVFASVGVHPERPAMIPEPVAPLRRNQSCLLPPQRRIQVNAADPGNKFLLQENHSFTHTNAASSSLTVIVIVVWPTSQNHSVKGMALRYTPSPPITISNNPSDANWCCPLKIRFKISIIRIAL